MTRSNLTIIVAADTNDTIGKDNKLIWHLPDDLKRFKKLTSGHHIIMGRKTFESFPKPLPNRTHIVITRQADYKVPSGVIVVNNMDDALDAASNDQQPFIIGGGEIYNQTIHLADKLYITHVDANPEGETHFPEFDPSKWRKTEIMHHPKDDVHNFSFTICVYDKI